MTRVYVYVLETTENSRIRITMVAKIVIENLLTEKYINQLL